MEGMEGLTIDNERMLFVNLTILYKAVISVSSSIKYSITRAFSCGDMLTVGCCKVIRICCP